MPSRRAPPPRPETQMMSYGYKPALSEGAIKAPIFQTSTFAFKSAKAGKAFFELAYGLRKKKPKEEMGLVYSRLNNPDLEILERRLALWDGAQEAAVFSSGMAAVTTAILEFVRPGDFFVYSEPVYGGCYYFFKHVLPRLGVKAVPFRASHGPLSLLSRLKAAGARGRTAMIFAETPANPTNEMADIRACRELAEGLSTGRRRTVVAVDNTFLGPLWQRPLDHGAHLVLYSATKFLGGHSDLVAGSCAGPRDLVGRVRNLRSFLGSMASPWTCWLLLRSLETLKIRMTAQAESAALVADHLAKHPGVSRVHYPAFFPQDSDQGRIYLRQCLGPGSMISFELPGGQARAFRFLDALRHVRLAVSLGGTESLAQHPATMTHADFSKKEQARLGISEGMIRLSIGVENVRDIIADLDGALRR